MFSDGLASDLMHICKASGVGAFVEEAQVPIHDEARVQAMEFHLDPITCALHGGEDYELLFTVDSKDLEEGSIYGQCVHHRRNYTEGGWY
jgi:thiamine-monophosphate kinase